MFTTVGYAESITPFLTYSKLAAVPDQHIKVAGDSVYVSGYNKLLGGYAVVDTTALGVRLVSPTLRRLAPVEVTPLTLALLPVTPIDCEVGKKGSITLDIDEQLECEIYGGTATPVVNGVGVWLADSDIVPVKGNIFSVRATITLALVAGVWQYSALEFAEDLPVGNYDCVGFDVVAGEGMIARLVPVGGQNRPGVPVRQLVSNSILGNPFRWGNMGVMCNFPHNNVPGVEVLALSAETSETYQCIVDLIKK
jgi:hypothetical protein